MMYARTMLALAAVLLLACSDDTTTSGPGGMGGAAGGQGGAGASGGSGGDPGTGGSAGGPVLHRGTLHDDGLVVRYYIDEATTGQMPAELIDAAPTPLNLPLIYINDPDGTQYMMYEQAAPRRTGLRFTEPGRDDRATAAIDGTKVYTAIHNTTSVTYEVVAESTAYSGSSSRFLNLGKDQAHYLSFETSIGTRLAFEMNGSYWVGAVTHLSAAGRVVMHAVLDTTQPVPEDRTRIYINGGLVQNVIGNGMPLDERIDLPFDLELSVGNRKEVGRTIAGVIYYAAIYTTPLTAAQVADNAALLLSDDDTPAAP